MNHLPHLAWPRVSGAGGHLAHAPGCRCPGASRRCRSGKGRIAIGPAPCRSISYQFLQDGPARSSSLGCLVSGPGIGKRRVSMTEPTKPSRRQITRRKLLIGAGLAAGLPGATIAWGYDPDWLTVERHKITIPGLEKPLTAAQISDLHADRAGSCSELLRDRVAEQVRRESPDLIFATGDYITRPGDAIANAAAWVAGLPAREGIYAVMGNHDSFEVKQALEAQGVMVLSNSWTKWRGIALAGVGDLSRWPHQPQKVLARVPEGIGGLSQRGRTSADSFSGGR